MYDYLDRPLASLDEGSRFLVRAMRGWTLSMAQRRCPPSMLAPDFARSDLEGALGHFHLAMTALNRDGLVRMGFATFCCPQVSEAEAILLAFVRLLATGQRDTANGTVALLVQADAAPILSRAMAAVAILVFARYPMRAPDRGLPSGVKDGK